MSEVLIFNAGGGQVLGRVTLRHAINMLHRKVASVREAIDGETFGGHQRPKSVELVRYVHAKWHYERTGKMPYSREGVLRRDRHKCAYCGRAATTMDHVVPACQGGIRTWMNAVAACQPCNSAKGGRTPEQAGMKLRQQPFIPSWNDIYPAGRRG